MVAPLNLLGQKFGKLTVIEKMKKRSKYGQVMWLCKCECGGTKVSPATVLNTGRIKSCGCDHHKIVDLTGKVFERLTVIKRHSERKNGLLTWVCLCACGKEVIVVGSYLKSGNTKSCGCLPVGPPRLPEGEVGFNGLYANYKIHAEEKSLVFDLTKEEFRKMTQENCFYCNAVPKSVYKVNTGKYIYNGVDRVDNFLGYTLKNCVPCCKFCNFSKRTLKIENFVGQIKMLINNLPTLIENAKHRGFLPNTPSPTHLPKLPSPTPKTL